MKSWAWSICPVESPTGDYYGGHRPGNNLYGESLVCVDLQTGAAKWHYQLVHHPLWDMDISSAPILADINVNGRADQGAWPSPTKQGLLYVFDRVTGKPVWPIEEKPVEKGESRASGMRPRNPFPPSRQRTPQRCDARDLIDFTPALHDAGLDPRVAKYKLGPGLHTAGGEQDATARWPRSRGHRQRRHQLAGRFVRSGNAHRLRVRLQRLLVPIGLVPPQGNVGHEVRAGTAGQQVASRAGPVRTPVLILPASARARGRPRRWWRRSDRARPPADQAALRNHLGHQSRQGRDRLAGRRTATRPTPSATTRRSRASPSPTGQRPYNIGTLVTKTLVIAGDGQNHHHRRRIRAEPCCALMTNRPARRSARSMPAPQSGSPMTYMLNGKQYIVVAVSGGPYSGEYLAFRLPDAEDEASHRHLTLCVPGIIIRPAHSVGMGRYLYPRPGRPR